MLHTFDGGEIDLEVFEEGEVGGSPYVDKKALIFRGGQQKGQNYTAERIAAIASNFSEPTEPTQWDTPLQLGHKMDPNLTVGSVRKLFADGLTLRGIVRYVGAEAVEKAKNGTWRRLSAGIDGNTLHHVAVVSKPHITDAQAFEESEDNDVDKPTKTETLTTPALPENFEAMQARLAQFEAQTAAMESKLAAQAEMIEKQQQLMRFDQLAAKVNQFSAEGKTLPAMREPELKLLQSLTDEQVALYEAVKAAQPELVNFSALGFQGSSGNPGNKLDTAEELDAHAKELAAKYFGKGE